MSSKSQDYSLYQLFIKKDDHNCNEALKLLKQKPGYQQAVSIIYIDDFLDSVNVNDTKSVKNNNNDDTKNSDN